MIKNCLHNLSIHENNNKMVTESQRFYYRGLIIGIVSALMESGKSFQSALKTVKDNLPDDCISLDNVIPDWQEGLK